MADRPVHVKERSLGARRVTSSCIPIGSQGNVLIFRDVALEDAGLSERLALGVDIV